MWYGLIIRKSYESGLKHVEEEIIKKRNNNPKLMDQTYFNKMGYS